MPRSFRYFALLTLVSSILLTPMTTAAQKPGPVRHVVVFKYKKDAAPDKIAQVTRAFRDLKGKTVAIISGGSIDPEKLARIIMGESPVG